MCYAEYHDNGGLGGAAIVFGTEEHGEALFICPRQCPSAFIRA